MEHSKHIWRVVLILLVLLGAFVTGRHFLVPPSFGVAGSYRYDSLQEYMAQPVVHGGRESCAPCHKERYEVVMKGKHAAVSCEVCHNPVAMHARPIQPKTEEERQQGKIGTMPESPTYRLCQLCHMKMAGRPANHPQIAFQKHLEEQGGMAPDAKIPEKVCLKCHDVHDPKGQ